MASSSFMPFLAMLLILLPMAARGDNVSPALSPLFEKLCEEVECGKGKCKVDTDYALNFFCECDSGWKRTPHDDDDEDKYATGFLPCVIPNCTLNYGCQPAPPPVPEKDIPRNLSAFDPCYWAYCGEGTCTKNRTYTHRCECKSGYSNLLDIKAFPCYSECTLGSDCAKLGIKVANETVNNNDEGQASSILPGKFHWMIILMMSMAIILWK
ncbi:Neurogenic locus notch-like protein [Quillaja saponaria]|uniref:Neurogenic locus notch-like protein n=1 Tax=Quillaja saponaria TaxID=32244 RepID=A0AAD7VJK5_QUISA|nr:Neurogenic locus notch-like protein [Quillaja saponaria]